MFYTLQITVDTQQESSPAQHRPISVETLTTTKADITEDEIEMVAKAFNAQIRKALLLMSAHADEQNRRFIYIIHIVN